jgi:predicted esterase
MHTIVRAIAGALLTAAVTTAAAAVPNVCIGDYGNPPRPHTTSVDGLAQSLYPVGVACALRGGEVLRWTDPEGRPRLACAQVPRGASTTSKRPMVVFLGGSLFRTDYQGIINGLELLSKTADLTGDPARPGFIYVSVEGRDIAHFYAFPNDEGLGWDNWYRNFNRNDPALNLDAAAIDHFIATFTDRGIVDPKRVYMMGHSNGGAMAILYGMNTRGIAATAVYSPVDPFEDPGDPCPQTPFGINNRPIMTIHNRCDAGLCPTGAIAFRQSLHAAMPRLPLTSIIISAGQAPVADCAASCASGQGGDLIPGYLFHLRWPLTWNDDYLTFLREHPLR